MAVVAVKSSQVTAQDAGTMANTTTAKGYVYSETDIASVTSGDSIASVYRLVRVPSNARMSALSLFTTAEFARLHEQLQAQARELAAADGGEGGGSHLKLLFDDVLRKCQQIVKKILKLCLHSVFPNVLLR